MGGGRSPSPNAVEQNKAFVRGLTDECNEEMISQVFSKYGRVTEVYVARDFETKAPRGFAFVTFESSKDCEDACKALNGKEFRGKPLHVERSAKPRGSGPSRGFRGGGRGRSGYVTRGRSPPSHSNKDYDYKSRASGTSRDDRVYSRTSHRLPYTNRAGRPRGPSPSREYDYHPRSPPMLASSRGDKYYSDVTSRDRYYRDAYDMFPKGGADYARSRYDIEYRAARPRHEYSPTSRREYEVVGRSYPPLPPREFFDYPPVNGRYSPGATRREYDSSRGYDMSRHEAYGYRPSESSKGYGGAYSSRVSSGFPRNSSPARPVPRDFPPNRETGTLRRPAMRSVSPPPKRMKTSDNFERRTSPQRGAPVPSRRF